MSVGVLWLFKRGFHVEFHVREDAATQVGLFGVTLAGTTRHIRHVVIRFHQRSIDKQFVNAGYGKDLETIDELLAQLPRLETVSLETSGMALAYGSFKVKAKLIRVRHKTRLNLCKQAHERAVHDAAAQADLSGGSSYSSPFWTLSRYERNRAWW